ncbi:hypothetical protein CQW23_23520 [Capsicum baccatum]|uniref:beta-ketoacyl-[acyl-carrier-protein] synthase I n=1 Tax=Capsicum baccatum TaxID=33114 RepID=A0A2G2VS66_CAPBA|nr:hypothetical protein CQW23_23520 [Capsicum baccatum]
MALNNANLSQQVLETMVKMRIGVLVGYVMGGLNVFGDSFCSATNYIIRGNSDIKVESGMPAGVMATDLKYINAHVTSTLAGDLAEANAIKEAFKGTSKIKINGGDFEMLEIEIIYQGDNSHSDSSQQFVRRICCKRNAERGSILRAERRDDFRPILRINVVERSFEGPLNSSAPPPRRPTFDNDLNDYENDVDDTINMEDYSMHMEDFSLDSQDDEEDHETESQAGYSFTEETNFYCGQTFADKKELKMQLDATTARQSFDYYMEKSCTKLMKA